MKNEEYSIFNEELTIFNTQGKRDNEKTFAYPY